MLTSGIFAVLFAIFAGKGTSGVDLQFFFICAQLIAVPYMAVALLRHQAALWHIRHAFAYLRDSIAATNSEIGNTVRFTARSKSWWYQPSPFRSG